MSKFYKCDICGKELSYGVGETARGLIWGKVQPAGPGVNAHVVYKKESEDFFLEDVCPDCMEKIMEKVEEIKNTLEIKRPRVSYKKYYDQKGESKC